MKIDVPPAPFYTASGFFKDPQLPLLVIHVEDSPSFQIHKHDFEEMVFICGGTGEHLINGEVFNVGRGDFFFIPCGTYHEYRKTDKLCYINLIFTAGEIFKNRPQLYNEILAGSDYRKNSFLKFRLSVFELRDTIGIINNIDHEIYQKDAAYRFMAESFFMQLWISVIRKSTATDPPENLGCRERILKIIRYLEKESGPEISNSDMAEEAGTSIRNFYRMFREITGNTPSVFINKLRIEKACELLRDKDKTITRVAGLSGYDDSNYFSRQFRQFKGCSPGEYRKAILLRG